MTVDQFKNLRWPLLSFGLVWGFVWLNLSSLPMQLRLNSVAGNYAVCALLTMSLPLSLAWLALRLPWRTARGLGVLAALLLALPCLLFACLVAFSGSLVQSNVDPAMEFIHEASTGAKHYRLYRTNCGATCAFGLLLREEIDLPIGMRLVTPRWSADRMENGNVVLDAQSVRVVDGDAKLWRGTR